jgi:hypothetical protein
MSELDEIAEELDEALRGERFVQVGEWMRQRGVPAPLPHSCAITAGLWRRIERIPFRILHSTTRADRVQHLVARALACLESYDLARVCADRSELTLSFSASLPCRAEDPMRQILHLRCHTGEGLDPALTLGLPADLPFRPHEAELVRSYRLPA